MLLPDAGVLLAGFRADHVHHRAARAFLDDARSDSRPLGLSDQVLASVIRFATSDSVFVEPDPVDAVIAYSRALLEPPGQLVLAGSTHWRRLTELCRSLQLSGNDVADAAIAAVAIEQAAELVTLDRRFARFRGLRWRCLVD